MDELHFLVEQDIEGGFHAACSEVSIFTEGETLQQIKESIKDAVRCHFNDQSPRLIHLRIIIDELITSL